MIVESREYQMRRAERAVVTPIARVTRRSRTGRARRRIGEAPTMTAAMRRGRTRGGGGYTGAAGLLPTRPVLRAPTLGVQIGRRPDTQLTCSFGGTGWRVKTRPVRW